ncbi:MAG: RNA polymerase sigma factor (TIGR02999 family) [Candidatus Krumholzibacteriia bacterium]|jgi:RNA polymerase sigma factor (TIGR02999 family)
MDQPHDLTIILQEASGGNRDAMGQVVSLVYSELRAIARRQHAAENAAHSLNTTGIVHEAYLKLLKLDRLGWQNREQFFAIAARSMRQILVDHARKRKSLKRGGETPVLSIDEMTADFGDIAFTIDDGQIDELLGLDLALQGLEAQNERHARIVECRFFTGLSIEETAKAIGISPATVKREWILARAWLNRELSQNL